MNDLSKLSPAALKAAMTGSTASWGKMANAETNVRYMEPIGPRSRRRCGCGRGKRATHRGMANGIALMSGCEMRVARWVRGGYAALAAAEKWMEG